MMLALLLALPVPARGQPAPPERATTAGAPEPEPATLALVIAFAGGRVSYHLASTRPAGMWTPYFPRVAARGDAGLEPVGAVDFKWHRAGDDVAVTVSVMRGPSRHDAQPVAQVTVTAAAAVVVDALAAAGVAPVTLSLVPVAPMAPYPPSVLIVTPDVEVSSVELVRAPYPGYRVTLRNLTARPVASVAFQSYRAERPALSGLKAGADGTPLIAPWGDYTFTLNVTSGAPAEGAPWQPEPLDAIEFTMVRWADGTTAGVPRDVSAVKIPEDAGRRIVLERAIGLLAEAATLPDAPAMLAHVRQGISALPTSDPARLPETQRAMRETRAMVLDDLRWVEQQARLGQDEAAVRTWLTATRARYEAWRRRLARV
jgi:hypothetical protein